MACRYLNITKKKWNHQIISVILGIPNNFLQFGCKICTIPVIIGCFKLTEKDNNREKFCGANNFCLMNSDSDRGSYDTITSVLWVTSGYFDSEAMPQKNIFIAKTTTNPSPYTKFDFYSLLALYHCWIA